MLEYAPILINQPIRSRQPRQQYSSPACCSRAHCKVAGLAVHICRCVVYNFITIYFIEIQIKIKVSCVNYKMRFISGITNVGKEFLKALDARFLLDHILHPIFNRKNVLHNKEHHTCYFCS